jgi:hypothetical protein
MTDKLDLRDRPEEDHPAQLFNTLHKTRDPVFGQTRIREPLL